ncbi:DNA polymerase I [Rhodoflexus caldus]|uniref:DNA polymerase I n=1 Tax=Rhodoflexus caldus TaxID=2891236 RepID=UPI00202A00A7|nr:DNA polymerase I [Rhodoflexus caldus]
MKKLFLLDAMALIYRAHFALSKNPRITSKGLNTSAVFGFTNTLLEVIAKEKPTHLGIAFDTAAPTFRHTAFEAYKAQRQEQPEDITVAIPLVKRLCRAMDIPVLELDGYEADDIIGTFAKIAARRDFQVYMMTPDKDYGQLVEENIFLYKPAFMGNGVEVLGPKEVCEKWGIQRVEQVVDILGLMGDAVDNIPGIPGIGEKTAAKLIAEFDTIENLLANTDKLKGKQKENVVRYAEQGLMSKELAKINTQVPLPFEEEHLKVHITKGEELKQLLDELEFRTIKKRLFGEESGEEKPAKPTAKTAAQGSLFAQPAPEQEAHEPDGEFLHTKEKQNIRTVAVDYHTVDTPELRRQLIRFLALQKVFCFDTETTSENAYEAEVVGLSFCYRKGEAFYVPLPENREAAAAVLQEFQEVFANEKIGKIGQNLKYDLIALANYGIEVRGELFDTMLAHYLIEPEGRHGMDIMAENYLNYKTISYDELTMRGKKQIPIREVPLADLTEYAAEDADITFQLQEKFAPVLKKDGLEVLFREVEMPLVQVLADMERAGVRIDTEALAAYSKELEVDIRAAEQRVYADAGEEFNIGSPKQLGQILFDKLKLIDKPKKTATGQYATGEEILVQLAPEHPIAQHILDFRQLQKLKSTYVDALPQLLSPKDGLIHTTYNQAVAATGRLSSNNPNLQNIPIRTDKGREIRRAFVPRSPDFVLMSADYSQIELRIMASFSKDESMIEAFRQKRDIHAATAAKIFKVPIEKVDSEMRRRAKTANFGIIYGISAFGLAQRLNIPRKEATELINAYFAEFPAVKKYMDEVVQLAHEREYVETILKRRRYLRDINSRNFTQRGFAERNAINAPIQGSAADLIKIAMIKIHNWLKISGLQSKMILQVHDELVFDVYRPEQEIMQAKVKELMESAFTLEVPLEVEVGVGENWLEAH